MFLEDVSVRSKDTLGESLWRKLSYVEVVYVAK